MDKVGCLGCDIANGRVGVAGGLLYESERWVINHCVGPLNLGTVVVAPREHICRVADLDDIATGESALLVRATARALEELCEPEQVYVCLWSHGEGTRKHLHYVVQPVTAGLVAQYGGLRSEQLQAAMLESGVAPSWTEVDVFCHRARPLLAKHTA